MNPSAELLKESWTLVEGRKDKVTALFYARLFLSHPDMRQMFPLQLQTREPAMLHAIVGAALSIDSAQHDDVHLAELGRQHRKYEARPEHYDAVGASLVEAMRAVAGEQWLSEYDGAWLEAYAAVARTMLDGAAKDPVPAVWPAMVVDHERRGRDVAVFTCLPNQPLHFRAGQHVSLECRQHPKLWRTYSVANAPREDRLLEFHVRAHDAGMVSGALVRRLRPGDEVRLATPAGSMTVDRRSMRDIVCVAGGTGLAPIKALVQDLGRFNRSRWVHVFFGARDRDDLYDLPALLALAARYPWLSIVPACSDDPTYQGERGLISDVVARYGPWDRHDFFLAGPAPMLRATLHTLAELRIPSIRINYDRAALDLPGGYARWELAPRRIAC